MPAAAAPSPFRLGFFWVAAVLVGQLIGGWMFMLAYSTAPVFLDPRDILLHGVVPWMLLGVISAAFQARALKPLGREAQRRWVAYGATAAFLVGAIDESTALYLGNLRLDRVAVEIGFQGLFGVIFGLAGWIVLRRASPRSWLWIPCDGACFAAAAMATMALLTFFARELRLDQGPLLVTFLARSAAFSIVQGSIIGSLTGALLVFLLRRGDARGPGLSTEREAGTGAAREDEESEKPNPPEPRPEAAPARTAAEAETERTTNLSFVCDGCGRKYTAPPALRGRRLRCKVCQRVFTIPSG